MRDDAPFRNVRLHIAIGLLAAGLLWLGSMGIAYASGDAVSWLDWLVVLADFVAAGGVFLAWRRARKRL